MMNKISNQKIIFLVIILFTFVLTGCKNAMNSEIGESSTIKIATLPVIDTLPMYVAEQEGLFTENGLNVVFIPASSAPKRDELISSEQADGMVNEVVSTVFYNRESTRVQIVRYARVATSETSIFRILTSGKSEIIDLENLKGMEIGVSKGTVIEYLTERLLQAEGFTPDEIKLVAIPDIGQRMALLGSGELEAAMLPDPLASLVMQQGANQVIEDSTHPFFSHSVYAFRFEYIEQHPEELRKFLAAIEDAVARINANPEKYTNLLTEKELVPAPLVDDFSIPKFVTSGVPTQEQWDDVINWIQEKGLEVGKATYQNSITTDFLP